MVDRVSLSPSPAAYRPERHSDFFSSVPAIQSAARSRFSSKAQQCYPTYRCFPTRHRRRFRIRFIMSEEGIHPPKQGLRLVPRGGERVVTLHSEGRTQFSPPSGLVYRIFSGSEHGGASFESLNYSYEIADDPSLSTCFCGYYGVVLDARNPMHGISSHSGCCVRGAGRGLKRLNCLATIRRGVGCGGMLRCLGCGCIR